MIFLGNNSPGMWLKNVHKSPRLPIIRSWVKLSCDEARSRGSFRTFAIFHVSFDQPLMWHVRRSANVDRYPSKRVSHWTLTAHPVVWSFSLYTPNNLSVSGSTDHDQPVCRVGWVWTSIVGAGVTSTQLVPLLICTCIGSIILTSVQHAERQDVPCRLNTLEWWTILE